MSVAGRTSPAGRTLSAAPGSPPRRHPRQRRPRCGPARWPAGFTSVSGRSGRQARNAAIRATNLSLKIVVNVGVDDEPLGGDAGWPLFCTGGDGGAPTAASDRPTAWRDERVAAAELSARRRISLPATIGRRLASGQRGRRDPGSRRMASTAPEEPGASNVWKPSEATSGD